MTTKRAKGRVSWITQRRLSEARNATDTCVLVRLWGFPGMWAGTGTGFSGHLFFLHITLPLLNLLGFLRRHMNVDKCTGRKESAGVRSPGKRNPQIHVVSLLSLSLVSDLCTWPVFRDQWTWWPPWFAWLLIRACSTSRTMWPRHPFIWPLLLPSRTSWGYFYSPELR